MSFSRRTFLRSVLLGSATVAGAARTARGLRIGVTDWNLHRSGRVDAVDLARQLGFEGVEVSLGRNVAAGKLPLDDPVLQQHYLEAVRTGAVAVAGTCLDILHVNPLKEDKLAEKWVAEGIPITRNLHAGVMLLPCFGKAALTSRTEMDYVADVLRNLTTVAERAGVLLGLENTLSAEDNVRIMERVASPVVKVYYDVGNSTLAGFDSVKEIGWLGAGRICQIHLKDNPHYLGDGKIDFPKVLGAIERIGFAGFANLETDCPSGSVEKDMLRNLEYVRRLLPLRGGV